MVHYHLGSNKERGKIETINLNWIDKSGWVSWPGFNSRPRLHLRKYSNCSHMQGHAAHTYAHGDHQFSRYTWPYYFHNCEPDTTAVVNCIRSFDTEKRFRKRLLVLLILLAESCIKSGWWIWWPVECGYWMHVCRLTCSCSWVTADGATVPQAVPNVQTTHCTGCCGRTRHHFAKTKTTSR